MTVQTQLALKPPYGSRASHYAKIKITRHGQMPTYEDLEDLLDLFGTHKPAIPKIYNCLKYSCQYECHLELGWFVRVPNIVRWCFSTLGMAVIVDDVKGHNQAELIEHFEEPVAINKIHDFFTTTYNRRGVETSLVAGLKKNFKAAMLHSQKAL